MTNDLRRPTPEQRAWILSFLGIDLDDYEDYAASGSGPATARPPETPAEPPHGQARQAVTGLATGVYHGGKSLVEDLAELSKFIEPFTAMGAVRSLVDPHAPSMRQSLNAAAGAVSGAYHVVRHPVATYDAAKAAVQAFRKEFEEEQAAAEKNGTETEFYSQFAGRAGFEIVAMLLPAGKLAKFLKLRKAEEVVLETGRGIASAEVTAKAGSVLAKAAAAEPALTRTVQGTAEQLGGKMEGLAHRLKTPDSLARKIAADMQELGLTADEAAARVADAVRYTATFPPEKLVAGAEAVLAKLQKDGCTIVKLKNTWLDPRSAYKGVNVQLRDKEGQIFELQFHTPESFVAKEEETHAIYEKMRQLEQGSPEWNRLKDEQMEIAKRLQVPTDIERLKPVGGK